MRENRERDGAWCLKFIVKNSIFCNKKKKNKKIKIKDSGNRKLQFSNFISLGPQSFFFYCKIKNSKNRFLLKIRFRF